MTDKFLPDGYKIPEQPSKYLKFEDGENKIRILSPALLGWEYWIDDPEEKGKRKPIRVRTEDELPEDIKKLTGRERAKHFWAFTVWNYQMETVQILEITQVTIMRLIEGLYKSRSWGDVKKYDIIINRTKTGSKDRDVEYSIVPEPKKELSKEIKDKVSAMPVILEALFENGDPFALEELAGEIKS